MTTLAITWPPRHTRENPSLVDLAHAVSMHVKAGVIVHDTFPGPRLVTTASLGDVEDAARLYLDSAGIGWVAS